MNPNRPEAGNMQMTDEQEHAIAHAQRVLRAVKLYDHADFLSASKPAAIDRAATKKGDKREMNGRVWICTDPDIDRWVSCGPAAQAPFVGMDREWTPEEKQGMNDALRQYGWSDAAPSPAQTERGAFTEWWDCEYGCTFDNIPGAMGGAFREVAQKAWNRRAALQAAPAAENAAPAQSGEPVADPKHDLHARIKIAREAGLQLRIDGKFGSDRYHSVTGSWPAVCRFAWALYNTAPQPAQTAQSDVCECGYSIETSCNVLDPACRRYTGKPAPSAVALDDDRAAFEAWAKEALEAHYDEHDSLITYDPVSAWLAWQASRRAALEESAEAALRASLDLGWSGAPIMDCREVGSACAASIRALADGGGI